MKQNFQVTNLSTSHSKTFKTLSVFSIFLSILFFTVAVEKASAETFTPISGQMDLGTSNANVISLQTFLAANPSIYPSGLVTGYFGQLTAAAIRLFQTQYSIDPVGRVGPVTIAKINSLITSGGWTLADATGPAFYNASLATNSNQATIVFTTNENTTARVVYSTNRLAFNEGDINSHGFGPIGGYDANANSGLSLNHSITIPNLIPNTNYYYTVIAADQAGNVSAIGPNNILRTTN